MSIVVAAERAATTFLCGFGAKNAQKKQQILLLFDRRSGPTRTGDRLHPMQEC